MARYIDADKAKEFIKNYGIGAISDGLNILDPVDDIVMLVKGVDLIPTADVAEVRHGQINWRNRPIAARYATVTDEFDEVHYGKVYNRIENNPVGYCSECGKRLDDTFMNYCPNCGAKMDGKAQEEVKCKDCEYFMYSDCYGECSKAYKGIVSPDDGCVNGKRR